MAVAVSGMGVGWKLTPRGVGRLYSGCSTVFTADGFRVAAGFGVCPGTDRTLAPNGRGRLAGGCWMGGITTALPGFKVESCSGARFGLGVELESCGGACELESMAGPSSTRACGVTVGSKLEDVEVDSVESSFMDFSLRSLQVTLVIILVTVVVALGPSFFTS